MEDLFYVIAIITILLVFVWTVGGVISASNRSKRSERIHKQLELGLEEIYMLQIQNKNHDKQTNTGKNRRSRKTD